MHLEPSDVVLFVGLAVGAFTDLRWGRLPNWLTFSMMALGLAAGIVAGAPFAPPLGLLAAFALHYPLWVAGIQRGGDAKLMMGLGALTGWATMLEATCWLAVLYLPIGLAVLAARGQLGNLGLAGKRLAAQARGEQAPEAPPANWMVTGPVIAIAGVLAWATDWLRFVG
jgi:prepilin peptidase CpaA